MLKKDARAFKLIFFFTSVKDRPRWRPKGARAPWVQFFIFSIQLLHILFLQLGPPSKTLGPFSPNQSSQSNPNNNYPTQNLNKNNTNIHNGDYILTKKLFYYQRTKKSCVIGEVKAKFFAITVNWYKNQLTLVSY